MEHVIMFREVSGFGVGSREFFVQATCSCNWEADDVHEPKNSFRAQLQGNEHLARYGLFARTSSRV